MIPLVDLFRQTTTRTCTVTEPSYANVGMEIMHIDLATAAERGRAEKEGINYPPLPQTLMLFSKDATSADDFTFLEILK